jgi:polar amino acid transport system substrate-binding protein
MKAAALLLGAVLSAGALAGDTLVACGDPDYAPFTYVPGFQSGDTAVVGSKIEGVAPDVLRLIFEPLGIKVEAIVQGNWKRCQVAVEDGSSDVLMAADKNEARMAYALFTQGPLAPEALSVFVRKGREFKFDRLEDLIGKRGGAPTGYSGGARLDAFFKEHQLIEYAPDAARNYMKLAAGRIDFVPTSLYSGLVILHKMGYGGKLVPLKNPLEYGYTYLPISRKSRFADKVPLIEASLKKLHADGTIDRLIKKHMAASGVELSR